MIEPDALFTNWIEQLAALTSRHAVPAAYEFREFTAAGGLMSYGSSLTEAIHQVGVYSGRIFKGKSRPTCQSSRPQRSNCSSTSSPPGRLASKCQIH